MSISRTIALSLALLSGPFGLDKIYIGQYNEFFFITLLNITGIGGIITAPWNILSIWSLVYSHLRHPRTGGATPPFPYRDDIDWAPPTVAGNVLSVLTLAGAIYALVFICLYYIFV